ncbi:short-chain dehydrogenase [Aeromicrobium sp. Leaf289]|uniref:SDR family NAD(P)-dependent oxidoreductase n=3 Tax=unclassified Aeromicrobium TaxID=2633570 RepID=UPI0006F5F412|nr:SDR family NAD(P)-dependent oxidoreductase [Aeromicrobium sp. Leaf289]KQP78225.1 short-chain dehydrogenase [Aeromicrobium sp. Leaf289]
MTNFAPGTRVLVTGAASGLGLALVTQLAERGCRVLATDVHADVPAPVQALAEAGPGTVEYRRLDVTSDVDWQTVRDHVVETWDGLDVLFNNAGVAAGGRIELSEMDQWQWIVDINLLGVVRGCRTFVPVFKQQGGTATIVNTASAAGLIHPPRMSEYNAVKAGVVALSETLFHELKPYGIAVSVVCPTFFKTNLTASMRGKDESAQASAAKLIDGSKRTAADIATVVLADVEKGRHIVLTDREGRIAYTAKRFLRPLYYREMAKAATRMARKD